MKILIVSSSKGNNYSLGQKISIMLNVDHELISLEDYTLPLFIPDGKGADKNLLDELVQKFESADGFIFCAPEYNAGIPPILTNTITWITVSTKQWRQAFLDKKALIATHSGSSAYAFLSAFRHQLEYMGCTVYHRNISIHKNAQFNHDSIGRILIGFKKLF